MVKPLIIAACLFLASCSFRNEYQSVRVPLSRFSITPNSDKRVYNLVDTSAVYLHTKVNGGTTIKDNRDQNVLVTDLKNIVKFYDNGRIGQFHRIDLNNIDLFDPKRAKMGIYNYSDQGFVMEDITHSVQAGVFKIRSTISVKGDTLLINNGQYKYEYVKLKIPSAFLIYTPDW